jgi:hypothetical protein
LDQTSSTSEIERLLMSIKVKMQKDKKLLSGRDTTMSIRDGELFILTKLPRSNQRVTTRDSDSTS